MKIRLLTYGVTWFFVKYATFAKAWNVGAISITALVIMMLGMLLFEFGKSLLLSGKHGIAYTIIMVLGAITFVADEFHIGWYIDFRNEIANNIFRIVAVGICGKYVIKMWRMILTREED